MTAEPEEKDDGIYFDAADLVTALKAILYTLDFPVLVDLKAPQLEHINLHARGERDAGRWVFYTSHKSEQQEDGPIGHA